MGRREKNAPKFWQEGAWAASRNHFRYFAGPSRKPPEPSLHPVGFLVNYTVCIEPFGADCPRPVNGENNMASSELSRTLSLLRKERGVSQRTAAADLGISQALLSHYEKGIREPGLAFVVRACDYYHVSADFLLGRTLSRDGAMLSEEDILTAADQGNVLRGSIIATLQSKLLAGAVGVLFDLLGKLNDKTAIHEAAAYLGTAVYQLYRRLYRTAGGNEAYFAAASDIYAMGAAADMALSEARYARALRLLRERGTEFPPVSDEMVAKNYPGRSQSVTQVLHAADSRLSGLTSGSGEK